ncbi:hypothetical protein JOQ06_006259, partial [Pogonophryne albipinna]
CKVHFGGLARSGSEVKRGTVEQGVIVTQSLRALCGNSERNTLLKALFLPRSILNSICSINSLSLPFLPILTSHVTEELSLGRNHIPGCLPGASGAWPVQRSLGSQEQWGAQMLLPSATELSLPDSHLPVLMHDAPP